MTEEKILELQKLYNVTIVQNQMNDGSIWRLSGSIGRGAMLYLQEGILLLPEKRTVDYYGNTLPARSELQPGTRGTLENAINFWTKVEDNDKAVIAYLQSQFNK